MDFVDTGPGFFYTEGSLRAGQLRNEFRTSALTDGMGNRANYTSTTPYYGLHFGTGYILEITDQSVLDIYGKYFWTRIGRDSVTLDTNDPVRFNSVDSHRVRLGSRFSHAVNDCITPYIGVAFEREFSGTVRASSYGHSLDAPSLRGNSGLGELGLSLTPSAVPVTFDLGVQGHVGNREGVSGTFQLRWDF
jgi:outer membrane autotransporter protein